MVAEKYALDSPIVDWSREQQRQWFYTHVKEKMSFMERTMLYNPFINYTESEVINKLELIAK